MEDRKIFNLAAGELCRYPFVLPSNIHYDPDATCPRWEQFLKEITCGDAALETYLKRMVGYCMTNSTSEQMMFVLLGDACSGKSVFLNIITMLMEDSSVYSDMMSFMFGKNGISYDCALRARLRDCRLVVLTADRSDAILCSSEVKQWVNGGKKLSARQIYGTPFKFVPKFKIILETNYSPRFGDNDSTIFRRVCLLPFKTSFAGKKGDKFLTEKLKSELPGIFNWALEGANEWCEHGLPTAAEE